MVDFNDRLKAAQASRPVSAKTSIPDFSTINPTAGQSTQAKASKNPQDFASWLMDILTRPLSGVTNALSDNISHTVDVQKAEQGKGDFLGALAGQVAGEQPLGVIGSFLTGLTSTDPNTHRSTSDLIEQSTDKIAPLADPNYRDVQDNVNPVLKGVAGFAGDVLLDPLTYIPGAQIAKVGKLGLEGLKAAGTVGKAAVEGASAALKAAKAVPEIAATGEAAANAAIKAETKVKPATPQTFTDSVIARMAKDPETAPAVPLEGAPVSKSLADVPLPKVSEQIAAHPQAASAAKFLSGLTPDAAKVAAKAVTDVRAAKPLEFNNWLEEVSKVENMGLKDMPSVKVGKQYLQLHNAIGKLGRTAETGIANQGAANSEVARALRSYYDEIYVPDFTSAKAAGHVIDSVGRKVTPKSPATVADTVVTQMQQFKDRVAADHASVSTQLGTGLTQALLNGRVKPENFDKTVTQLKGVLDGSINVDSLTKLSTPLERMLGDMGIMHPASKAAQRAKVANPDVPVNGTKIAPTVADFAAADGAVHPVIVRDVQEVVNHSILRDILHPQNPEKYPYVTAGGAKRTAEIYGEGNARNLREANTYFQWSAATDFMNQVIKMAEKQGLRGIQMAEFKQAEFMQRMRLFERYLDNEGVPLTVGVDTSRIPLGYSQVWDTLNQVSHARTLWYGFNGGTSIPPTNLLEAVNAAVKGAEPGEIEALLRQTATKYTKSGQEITYRNRLAEGGTLGRQTLKGDRLIGNLVSDIQTATPALKRVVEANAAELAVRRSAETLDISDDVLKSLEQAYTDTVGQRAALEAINNVGSRVTQKAESINATQSATAAADSVVEGSIPKIDSKNARSTQRIVDAQTKVKERNPDAITDAGNKASQTKSDDMARETTELLGSTMDFGETAERGIAGTILGRMSPVVSKFVGSFGNETYHSLLVSASNLRRSLIGNVNKDLTALNRSYSGLVEGTTTTVLQQAMRDIQSGVVSANPQIQAAADGLSKTLGEMFDLTDKPSLLGNAFFRENINIHHLNDALDAAGMEHLFDVEKAATDATANGTEFLDEISQQWKGWDIKDPVDFSMKMYSALTRVNGDASIGQTFTRMATDLGKASSVPKPGYSRVINSGGSVLAKYMPKDTYFEDVTLHEMNVLDNIMRESYSLSSPFGRFVQNNVDPIQNWWKAGMTIWRPGHHVRNLVGDMSLSFLDGVSGFTPYRKALKAMATHNSYDNVDIIQSLQSAGIHELPHNGTVISSGLLKGKKEVEVTAEDFYKAAGDRGLLPNFHVLENLDGEALPSWAQSVSKAVSITGGRAKNFVGGVSEYRDHYVRLAHLIDIVDKDLKAGKHGSLDEIFDAAAARVKKWHPDGSDLTSFENKYMRRLIPFYSWQRKAIPLVVEAMLMHPARFTAFPKAQYNAAVAQGIDPASLSDPFPTDQLFPSFLTDQVTGPAFKLGDKYYGINPGIAQLDVVNQYGGDPIRGIASGITPLIKVPGELLGGTNWGTGSKINSIPDYIDSQVPFVSTLANVSGTSVSGLGQPQFQVAKGNKQPFAPEGFINYLTGLGLQDMSRPNYINLAEIQARNRAGSKP